MPTPRSAAQAATRSATLRAVLLVLSGSIGMQIAAVLAIGVFDTVGVLGTSGLRFAIAAAFLLVLFRPRLTGRTREE